MNTSLFSIQLTIAILFSSLGGVFYTYDLLEKEKLGTVAQGVVVPREASSMSMYQNDNCVGAIHTEWKTVPDGLELNMKGSINKTDQISIDGQASFNPIGQLVGSVFKLTSNRVKLVIGSKGINKIELVLNGSIGGKDFKFTFPVQGPIELVKGTKAFTIIAPRASIHSNNLLQVGSKDALKQIIDSFQVRQTSCTQHSDVLMPEALSNMANTIQRFGGMGL